MEMSTMECGKIISDMVMVNICTKTVRNILDNGRMIKCMGLVNSLGLVEPCTSVASSKTNFMDLEHIMIEISQFIKASGTMVEDTEK